MPLAASPTEVADLLERAAARLDMPGAWTQHHYATDADGRDVASRDPSAVCWCAFGALASLEIPLTELGMAATRTLRERWGAMVSTWNDAPGRAQAEVVAELRAAAADVRAA